MTTKIMIIFGCTVSLRKCLPERLQDGEGKRMHESSGSGSRID